VEHFGRIPNHSERERRGEERKSPRRLICPNSYPYTPFTYGLLKVLVEGNYRKLTHCHYQLHSGKQMAFASAAGGVHKRLGLESRKM